MPCASSCCWIRAARRCSSLTARLPAFTSLSIMEIMEIMGRALDAMAMG
ncbi:hypothetical protein [Candidatus Skiveiella danica]